MSRNDNRRSQFDPSAGSFRTFSFHKLHSFVFDILDALRCAVLLLVLQVTLEEELDLLGRNAEVDHPIEERPERGGELHEGFCAFRDHLSAAVRAGSSLCCPRSKNRGDIPLNMLWITHQDKRLYWNFPHVLSDFPRVWCTTTGSLKSGLCHGDVEKQMKLVNVEIFFLSYSGSEQNNIQEKSIVRINL